MPIDYKQYPANWKTEIRPYVLARARHRCEQCGVKNKTKGLRDKNGRFYSCQYIMAKLENEGIDLFDGVLANCYHRNGNPTLPITIVLTVAHMDHNHLNNEYTNLRALCQRCHLRHDRHQHAANARATRARKTGQQTLWTDQ